MEHINTYEEDLKEVNSQIEKLQAKQEELIKTILEKEANNLIGDICNKVYYNESLSHFAIFHHVSMRVDEGFEYSGYAIRQNGGYYNFSVCYHQEVFLSRDDFNEKYEPITMNTKSVLHNLIDTFKSVNYETTTDD